MSAIAMDFGEYDVPQRNQLAHQTIEKYAAGHALADIGIGLAGFLPIPGAGPAAILSSMALQVPIYKCLAGDLRRIYLAETPDGNVNNIVNSGIVVGSALELAADLGTEYIVNQVGADFLQEILSELLGEIGIGLSASLVPFFGGFVCMGLDLVIATTMTWRVGTMVSIYYQNGGRWIGNRQQTYERAKEMTGGLSAKNSGRVDLNDVPRRNKPVHEHLATKLARFVQALLDVDPNLTDDKIHDILRKRRIAKDLAERAIQLARGS